MKRQHSTGHDAVRLLALLGLMMTLLVVACEQQPWQQRAPTPTPSTGQAPVGGEAGVGPGQLIQVTPVTSPPTVSPEVIATREAQLDKTHLPGPPLPKGNPVPAGNLSGYLRLRESLLGVVVGGLGLILALLAGVLFVRARAGAHRRR